MGIEENKAAVRRFYDEVINGGNLDVIDELQTPDGMDHTFGSQGVDASKQFFAMLHSAFPDLHVEVHDLIGEGDLVAARVTYTGTQQGQFVGIPPTGRHATTAGIDFFRLRDGKQSDHWGGPDLASLLQQLGVIPGLGQPS